MFGAFALSVWTLLRLALWLSVGPSNAGWENSAAIFAVGLFFDVATLAFLLVPFLLLSAANRRANSVAALHLWRFALLWLLLFALIFDVVAEFLFWQEFTTRFNFIAIDYLLYTHEVVGNVLSSYPLSRIIIGIAVATTSVIVATAGSIRLGRATPPSGRKRIALLIAALLLPTASYSLANLDITDRIANAHAGELASNGLFTLAAAMRRNELDYERNYLTLGESEAQTELAQMRSVTGKPAGRPAALAGSFVREPRHVVLITVESLSAEFLGVYGNRENLTPNLDRLAREGVRFEHMYATGTRTVRGLEALSLGTPPIPGQSIIRRPGNEHLITLGELLQERGFSTYFIYGGYGYFDNMNAYFAGNDYRVVDRTDFARDTIPFENIWGVADEALFTNVLRTLDNAHASGRRFFATVMTTSNHRPFTYPDGRIDIRSPGGREGAVKYTDYAIGRFIAEASTKPWYADTLFVIIADHCAAVAGRTKLPVERYRIPLILYGPTLVKPLVYPGLVSQIDVPPTLLDILHEPGAERFYGRSLMAGEPERAFVSNYQELGYYESGVLTVLSPKRRASAFAIDPQSYAAAERPVDPALLRKAIAYYQTASLDFRRGKLKLGTASPITTSGLHP